MNAAIPLLPSLVMLAAGCANIPYSTPAGRIPGTSAPGSDPGSTIPNVRGKAAQYGSREICRDSPFPRGWIAVDYVSSSGGCRNSMRDAEANTAIIVRYATLPPESILVICSDQHVPPSWMREPDEPADASSTQCPRRPGDTRTGSTILRIRRRP
jgi:hypothetical protein